MSADARYVVEAKIRNRWEAEATFDHRGAAERALAEAAERPGVVLARLLCTRADERGGTVHQVLNVVQRTAAGLGEVAGPGERAVTTAPTSAAGARFEDREAPPRARSSLEVAAHGIVYYEPGEFSAWPANNGAQAWQWGDEILIGFINGTYEEREGHNWAQDRPLRRLLARSSDGGQTWSSTEPLFGGDGPAPGEIDFAHPGFALRVFDEREEFYISYDRGRTWPGPYSFGDLFDDSPVAGDEFTARTDYIVDSSSQALFFLSSRRELIFTEDYSYVARTGDGGRRFEFLSFVDPFDIDRNVMPSTVRINESRLVTATRRKDEDSYWIEAYRSDDNGASWSSLGQVDSTGDNNGNPAALVRLADGTLVCIYGVRQRRGTSRISAKVSSDNGRSWSTEYRLRDDFVGPDAFGDTDLGYPRAFVRPDAAIVAVYYWATAARPEQHIASTIFRVLPGPPVEVGRWRPGVRHEAEPGDDRLLVFTLHYVENGSTFKEPKRVRYGGQTLTKLLERDQEEKDKRTYIAMFYLPQDDIRKAEGDRFEVDWDPNRPDNWQGASVFLANVDQRDPFGDKDTSAIKSGNRLGCHTFRSVPAGDAVILAGTARKRGRFEVTGGFVEGGEFNLRRGGTYDDGDGVVGHRLVVEPGDQRGAIEHSDPGILVLACAQIRKGQPVIA